NQALSLASGDPKLQYEVCMRLGDVFLLMKPPDPDQSIQQFTRAAELAAKLDKTTPAPYLSLARAYRSRKDQGLDGAVASLKQGLPLCPADKSLKNELASTYNALGKQQKDAKDYPKSVRSYQEAIALDPPDVRLKAAAYLEAGIVLVWNRKDIP